MKATLTNDTGNQGVTWSSSGGGSFSPTTSTSGSTVTFTAPSSAGVVTITAKSVADSTKTASATIGVTDLAGVFTYHNDLSRDGAIYAQPLWIRKVNIRGATHNVILLVSFSNSVYLFDADASPCITYWHKQ